VTPLRIRNAPGPKNAAIRRTRLRTSPTTKVDCRNGGKPKPGFGIHPNPTIQMTHWESVDFAQPSPRGPLAPSELCWKPIGKGWQGLMGRVQMEGERGEDSNPSTRYGDPTSGGGSVAHGSRQRQGNTIQSRRGTVQLERRASSQATLSPTGPFLTRPE